MTKYHKWILAVAVFIGGVFLLQATPLDEADRDNVEVAEQAIAALQSHPHVDASGLQVSVKNGVATIVGYLQNPAARRFAIEAVKNVRGVNRVIDKIVIEVGNADGQTRSQP